MKTAEAARSVELDHIDDVDARSGGPAPNRHLESPHGVGIAFGDDLDAAVVFVAHISAQVLAPRGVFDKQAETHTLDSASDAEPASDEHGRLYRRVQRKKGRRSSAPFTFHFLVSSF